MFLIAWLLLFGMLFFFFYLFGKSESTVKSFSRSEMVLSSDGSGHYSIKGRINDYPVHFLVDTGATFVAVPEQLATRLKLQGRYPITMSTANGDVTGYLTRINELRFGDFVFQDIKAVIMPSNDDDTVLLGMNILSQFNISQQGRDLILKRQP